MPSDTLIEHRLSAVEDAVVEIQRRLAEELPSLNWVERFTGSFKDEPAFSQVVAYGQALRLANRPQEDGEA